MSGQAIVRVVLTGSDGTLLPCQFNSSTLRLSKTLSWYANLTRGSRQALRAQFVGMGPETLFIKLLFDGFDSLGGIVTSVLYAVSQLLDWMCVPALAYEAATPQPLLVTFRWGIGVGFTGFLYSVNAEYTMFALDGTLLRATVDITLQCTLDDLKGINLTFGGVVGRCSAVLGDADSFVVVAYREYGDAVLWRVIAQANGVEDPVCVLIGICLLILSRIEVVGGSDA